MHAEPQSRRHEPIAIVGIAALYPEARGAGAFWRLLGEDSLHCGCADAGGRLGTGTGAGNGAGVPDWNHCGRVTPDGEGLDDLDVDVARFGIPPAQARSMARMQVLMLEAARQCLIDAGYSDRAPATDRTDVVAGTCFGLDRQYANAQRIETRRYARELERVLADGAADGAAAADELRSALLERFGGSPHDRVGEMASTIPARIAGAFKLRGRTLTVESADATSYVALAHAVSSLRGNVSDAVLVLTGQRREGPLLASALAAKGLLGPGHPFAADGRGFALGEGVGALLLKRLSSAMRDGDRVYASILDCSLGHDPRPGTFRYSTSVDRRRALASRSCRTAGVSPESVQYVECAGSGIAAETAAELAALGAARAGSDAGSVPVGSVRDRLGHTFANAGLAAVSKIALALYHRTIPPHWSPNESAVTGLSGTPFRLPRTQEPWPKRPGAPRRAAVTGASVTGALCHLVLEEYDSRAPSRTGSASPARSAMPAEPIAVVGFGGYFADAPDAEGFWRAVLSGRDRIGPVPESRFDRDLYHDPDALSLTHSYTDQGAYAEVPDAPPAGVRLTPRRFAAMDGAQRVCLTVAAELFARGLAARTLRGSGVVAVGSTLSLTGDRRAGAELDLPEVEAAVAGLAALEELPRAELDRLLGALRERCASPPDLPAVFDGCLASGVAALIAAEYRLDAVPLAVEAACASSLAALDVAVGALRTGTADFAIAGGVELACNTRDMVLCSSLGLLSHGKITPFDAGADGFTPGDGCALFLLKRYEDARRDGDPIAGLIRGIGASNDAKSLIAPDADGQARAMQQAFEQVDFEPAAVDYLEAHGTGTRVGDRVEMAAAAQVYSKPRRSRPLEVGSAKSFFGHTFAAAGSAGLLRALQAMRHRTLPPNAGLRELSPTLGLHDIPAVISTGASPWRAEPGRPRRAGVSSFGTGGINYHLLVEEHTGA
jgi:acyl transferase domain-containing protein